MLLISRGCLAINKLLPLILPPTYMDHGINIEYAAKFNAALDIPVGVIGARHPLSRPRRPPPTARSSTSPCAARTSPIPTA